MVRRNVTGDGPHQELKKISNTQADVTVGPRSSEKYNSALEASSTQALASLTVNTATSLPHCKHCYWEASFMSNKQSVAKESHRSTTTHNNWNNQIHNHHCIILRYSCYLSWLIVWIVYRRGGKRQRREHLGIELPIDLGISL